MSALIKSYDRDERYLEREEAVDIDTQGVAVLHFPPVVLDAKETKLNLLLGSSQRWEVNVPRLTYPMDNVQHCLTNQPTVQF